MNKITLIGNLTHDPESRATPSGVSVCTFTIAVNRRFASGNGEKETDYFRINAWRGLADSCGRYLSKGRKVAVIGELQARMYEAKDGTSRMSLDVNAEEVEFLSPKGDATPAPAQEPQEPQDSYTGFTDVSNDDISF